MSSISSSTKIPSNRIALGMIFLLTLAFVCSVAQAAESDGLKISYSAYELESAGATSALYQRIDRVVRNYCSDHGTRSVSRKRRENACRQEMLDKAISKINDERLRAIHHDTLRRPV